MHNTPVRASRSKAGILLSLSIAVAAIAAGCSGSTPRHANVLSRPPGDTITSAPPRVTSGSPSNSARTLPSGTALVAEPSGPTIDIYASPNTSRRLLVLSNPWLLNGVSDEPIPQTLLVLSTLSDGWIQVQLPVRPNGSKGWIAPGSAQLLHDNYRIEVSLHVHVITVFKDGSAVYTGPIASGTPQTPTPVGLFYIRVLLRTTDPSSVYGPYAYGLSAHSEALTSFDGGDAEIGIHGNNDASVLGRSVTHGCVRMDNTEISRLAAILPLGTPVQITA
jgi:lipoprotein-anchoring transpeptidase ErfK/SrfK